MIKNSWRGPVGGLVVAAAIIGSAFYFWGLWPILLSLVKAAPALFTSLIPTWVLLLVAPFVVFVIMLVYFIYSTRESEICEPDFVAYTDDTIFDIAWSWRWLPPTIHGNHYALRDLTPYCPSCSAVLTISDRHSALVSCSNGACHWQWERQHQHESPINDAAGLDGKVRHEINRRIQARVRK
ncbi:hypothetical protein D3C77_517120 [compost metagenome]